jgi:hypothetical protein
VTKLCRRELGETACECQPRGRAPRRRAPLERSASRRSRAVASVPQAGELALPAPGRPGPHGTEVGEPGGLALRHSRGGRRAAQVVPGGLHRQRTHVPHRGPECRTEGRFRPRGDAAASRVRVLGGEAGFLCRSRCRGARCQRRRSCRGRGWLQRCGGSASRSPPGAPSTRSLDRSSARPQPSRERSGHPTLGRGWCRTAV